jgi:DNA-binding Lrp family transcriptional regulator
MVHCGRLTEGKNGSRWELTMFLEERGIPMVQAYVLIEAEPARIRDLVSELAGMQLAASVIKEVHAITGRFDLIARVESPDLQSLGE